MGILEFIEARVYYTVKTDKPEIFVNALRKSVDIKNIETQEEIFKFSCSYRFSDTADAILKEKNAKIADKRCFGILYTLKKYKKRAGLFAGLVLSLLFIFISSLYVWDIRIEGNETVSDSTVLQRLKDIGFDVGVRKKSVDLDSVVNHLLINENSLSWASINFDGTVAHVEVREAAIGVPAEKKENVNLVASHNGIIIRVDALDGSAVVGKGDTVVKGQLLVSAFVEKRTGGSLLKGARGYVWANTEHSYRVEVPYIYTTKQYTGNSFYDIKLKVLGKEIKIPRFATEKYRESDVQFYSGKIRISESMYLPLDVESKRVMEYKSSNVRRTQKGALELAKKTALERLKNEYPSFVTASADEDYAEDGEKLIYTCTYSGVENIAQPLEFVLS